MATAAKKTPSVTTLTKQLKEAREYAAFLSKSIIELNADNAKKAAKRETEQFGLGYDQGQIQAAYEFSQLNWLQRLRYKP